jgi:UDP-glucose:glycoprotein glucosyltransferase
VQQELTAQLRFIQEQLAVGIQPKDVSRFFYDLPEVPVRRSKLITPGPENKLKVFNLLDLFEMDSTELSGRLANDFVYSRE